MFVGYTATRHIIYTSVGVVIGEWHLPLQISADFKVTQKPRECLYVALPINTSDQTCDVELLLVSPRDYCD